MVPKTGRIGASLVVNCWAINSVRRSGANPLRSPGRVLRHLPPHHPKQRRHRLLLPPLSRRRRLTLTFFRLLVAVVLELFLANGLLGFFRRQGGQYVPLRTATGLRRGPPRRCATPPQVRRGKASAAGPGEPVDNSIPRLSLPPVDSAIRAARARRELPPGACRLCGSDRRSPGCSGNRAARSACRPRSS
jgi:hypothetical protein